MLDNNMIKYRKKHPKCDWCKYYQFNSKCFGEINWDECILKDKIIIRDIEGIESTITYEQLNKKFNLSNINKQNIIQFLSRKFLIFFHSYFVTQHFFMMQIFVEIILM